MRPPNRQILMARIPLNPKVGPSKFKGKGDANSHVSQFETSWTASGYGPLVDVVKKQHFGATLKGDALAWLGQYGIDHFTDYNQLKNDFLRRLIIEKTPKDVLYKLQHLKQNDLLVESYAQQFKNVVKKLD